MTTMTTRADPGATRSARRTLMMIAAAVIAPVALSYFFYYLAPRAAFTNYGELLPTASGRPHGIEPGRACGAARLTGLAERFDLDFVAARHFAGQAADLSGCGRALGCRTDGGCADSRAGPLADRVPTRALPPVKPAGLAVDGHELVRIDVLATAHLNRSPDARSRRIVHSIPKEVHRSAELPDFAWLERMDAPARAPRADLATLPSVQEPESRLLGAALWLQSSRATTEVLALAVDTASARGWRRPLVAWLAVQQRRAEQAGDREEAARLARRIELVLGGPPPR